jgi:hypothetical protein
MCSGSGFLLRTSLLKACELRRILLMRSSPRSYRIPFRNSSGTVPDEYRSTETPVSPHYGAADAYEGAQRCWWQRVLRG